MTRERATSRGRETCWILAAICLSIVGRPWSSFADDPTGELARRLADVKFTHYVTAPGYSEGPTWWRGAVYFCSGGLLRADKQGPGVPYLEIGPAGTVRLADDHLLVCDNLSKALLDVAPDGRVTVVADRDEMEPLRSLNDVTVDGRGNVYWTDPEGSSADKPIGRVYRLRPDGRVDRLAANLAFPNGLDVDPASRHLYVIESQSKKILRYALPADDELLGRPEVFYDLGGSGGDGCAFDAAGNLWVADFHRPDTQRGRITVLSPDARVLAYLPIPAKVVSNIAFGGPEHDEIFCTTGDPPGVFRAKVGVKGFAGHPGKTRPSVRTLNVVPIEPHPEAAALRTIFEQATTAPRSDGRLSAESVEMLRRLIATLGDASMRERLEKLLPETSAAAALHDRDAALAREIQRLGGKAKREVFAPTWLRAAVGDSALGLFSRFVEIDLNERTDGHKAPENRKPDERVTDAWLARLADQERLRRLELSGTAVTSAGLVHLKGLKQLERLNLCLTECDDRGFEHLAGLTEMRRLTVCSSKITGVGFTHLQALRQLESINLHSSPASDEGLAAIGRLTSLKRLEIVHTNVTDAGLKHLAGLTRLQQLHVHGPRATADALPFLTELKELYELDVYDQAASNATLERVAALPKLRKLMLVSGTFDDEGVRRLRGLSTLEELTLDSPRVTDASIDVLVELPRLRKLHLGASKLTPEGRRRLAERLPRTSITP